MDHALPRNPDQGSSQSVRSAPEAQTTSNPPGNSTLSPAIPAEAIQVPSLGPLLSLPTTHDIIQQTSGDELPVPTDPSMAIDSGTLPATWPGTSSVGGTEGSTGQLSSPSPGSGNTAILDEEQPTDERQNEKKYAAKRTVKSKGFYSISEIFSSKLSSSTTEEAPKIAIKPGLRGNWIKLAPHIAAMALTGGVSQLSFRNVYWMDLLQPQEHISPGLTQGGALNFLQLAAKLHELVILTSISSIVLHVAQIQLTGRSGLPIGMIANAFELGSAQFLRRKSFWSFLWTVNPATGKRFPFKRFWLLSILSTLLVLLSGPSSAIAVIPTLNFFDLSKPFNQTTLPFYIFNSTLDLWPQRLTVADLPTSLEAFWDLIVPITCTELDPGLGTHFYADVMCPGGGSDELFTWSQTLQFQNTDIGSNVTFKELTLNNDRLLQTRSCNTTFHGRASGVSSNGFISQAIEAFWLWNAANLEGTAVDSVRPRIVLGSGSTVFAPQVETVCQKYFMDEPYYFDGTNPDDMIDINFPTLDDSTTIPVPDWTYKYAHPLNETNITFVDMPYSGSPTPSLGVVFILPTLDDINGSAFQVSMTIACSVYAQWVPVDVWYEPKTDASVSYSVLNGMSNSCFTIPTSHKRRDVINITINSDWAVSMNQPGKYNSGIWPRMTSLFEGLTESTDSIIPGSMIFISPQTADTPSTKEYSIDNSTAKANSLYTDDAKFVSTILAAHVTDALARVAGNGAFKHSGPILLLPHLTANGTLQGITPGGTSSAGSLLDLNTTSPSSTSSWLLLDLKFQRYGYGYSWSRSPTAQFGITVLLIHTSVAFIYSLYILSFLAKSKWKGGFPKAWETIPELVALAVNSGRSERFEGTCVGIKQTGTWGEVVGVREVGALHLELVVGRDKMEEFPQAKVGAAYG